MGAIPAVWQEKSGARGAGEGQGPSEEKPRIRKIDLSGIGERMHELSHVAIEMIVLNSFLGKIIEM